MKLHLNKGLRRAVLACMAVVGSIATTVGTGFVAGGSVAIAFVAAQAQAATYEITTNGDGNLISATAEDNIILNLTGWLTPNGALTINAPVEIVKGEINNGSSNRTYTFKNTITGSGDFSYCPPTGRGATNQTYVFEGDMSAYSGNMSIVADKKGTFTFKGKTGTGAITALHAESVVNIKGATVNNSSINASTINISGVSTFKSDISLNASNAINIYGLLNVEAGTLKFTGDTKLGAGVRVAAGASLVNEGTITLTSYDLLYMLGGDSYQDATGAVSENGYRAGRFTVIEAQAGATITGVNSVVMGGETLTTAVDKATGNIYVAAVDKRTYRVNTQVAYAPETMAEVGSFTVFAGATLTTTDATMLNKVTLADASSSLYLTNSEGTKALKLTGAQGSVGLPLDVAAEVDEDGYLVVNSTAGNNVDYRGSMVVLSGTKLVAASNPDSFGKNYLTDTSRTITVQGGAVVNLNGMESYYHYVLEDGAVVTNSGRAIATDKSNMPVVDLLGNAEIRTDSRIGIIGYGYGDTQLNLNGNTLTKVGSGVFHLRNTDVSAGTLNVQEGTLEWLADTTMTNTTLQLGGGALLNHDGGSQNLGSLVIATTVGSGTGATIDVYGGRGPLTVTGATKADELLTKKGPGQLNLNGATLFNAGVTVENGTLVLNSATTIGGVITVSGGTLTIGTGGSVSIGSLTDFAGSDTEVTVPETNGLVGGTYKVLDKAEGATVNNFSAINYGGTSYTLSEDGSITIDGGKIYYAVEAGSVVTVGGDAATAGTADATEFYVKDGATLAFAGEKRGTFTPDKLVQGDGTVRVTFAGGNHEKSVSMATFSGTVEAAGGHSNITTYNLGEGATLKLTAGEHWSNGGTSNLDILLSDTKNSYVFYHSNTLTLNGKVSGQYLDLGTTRTNGGTLVLTNSANDIKHVTLGTANNTAKLTLAADMGFTTINAAKADSVVTLNDGVTLTLGTGTSAVTTLALAGNGGLNISEQASLTITTQQGGGTLTKDGAGTLTITGNSAASAFVINGGELVVNGATMAATTVSGDGTLKLAGEQTGTFTPAKAINGDGTVQITFSGGIHDKGVLMSTFAGTVEIAGGNSNITTYSLGEGATLKLTAGEHWSNGGASNLDILLSDTKNSYVFRQSFTLTLSGKVSGQYLDLGTTNSNGGTLVLTNSANDIKHVTVGTASNTSKLTLAADMGFTTINAAKEYSVVTLNDGVTLTLGTGTAAETSAVTTLALAGNGGLNINEQAALTVTTQQGGGTLTKAGAGTLTITGNSAASALVINGGELVVNGATMAATTVSGDGTLKLAGDTNTFSNGVTLAGKVDFNGKSITGDLTLADTVTVTGVVSASNIAVGTYSNTTGMVTAGDITVGTALNSSAKLTATKITGAGNVNITGGKVTLNGSTDAFACTGSLAISDAELVATNAKIEVGASATLQLSNGAAVTADEINIAAGATLALGDVAITTSISDLMVAAYRVSSLNVINADLTFAAGSTLVTDGIGISMTEGSVLTFNATSEGEKINLVFTLGTEYGEEGLVQLFSNVDIVKFLMDGKEVDASTTLLASDFFTGDCINENTTLHYDSNTNMVYLQGVSKVVPEPTTATLSLLALAALAMRRRRK